MLCASHADLGLPEYLVDKRNMVVVVVVMTVHHPPSRRATLVSSVFTYFEVYTYDVLH